MPSSTDFARRRLGTGLADLSAANEILNNLDNSPKTGDVLPSGTTQTKTANYTVLGADSGKYFDNNGAAGSVTFTFDATTQVAGFWCNVFCAVDQQVQLAFPAGTLVGANNAARTSYTTGAAGTRIGTSIEVYCNGSKYFLFLDLKGLTIGTFA